MDILPAINYPISPWWKLSTKSTPSLKQVSVIMLCFMQSGM